MNTSLDGIPTGREKVYSLDTPKPLPSGEDTMIGFVSWEFKSCKWRDSLIKTNPFDITLSSILTRNMFDLLFREFIIGSFGFKLAGNSIHTSGSMKLPCLGMSMNVCPFILPTPEFPSVTVQFPDNPSLKVVSSGGTLLWSSL